jgi:hypothetical protein
MAAKRLRAPRGLASIGTKDYDRPLSALFRASPKRGPSGRLSGYRREANSAPIRCADNHLGQCIGGRSYRPGPQGEPHRPSGAREPAQEAPEGSRAPHSREERSPERNDPPGVPQAGAPGDSLFRPHTTGPVPGPPASRSESHRAGAARACGSVPHPTSDRARPALRPPGPARAPLPQPRARRSA